MLTVLSIEDNPDNMILIDRVVEGLGYKFVTAEDGTAGLQAVERYRPDLILLDINLPDIDGYEIARRLKADDNYKNIPIIAVTANALRGDEKKALEAGCDAYIAKPIMVGNLRRIIESVVEQFIVKK